MSENRLTREQFDSEADWLRYCHEGGLDPWTEDSAYAPPLGDSEWAQRTRALYGHSKREYQRAWEGYGVSGYLTYAHFLKAYRAVALANCLGRLMDISVTITWTTVGIDDDTVINARQRRFLELIQTWCFDNNTLPSWVWVYERGKKLGLHTHMLLGVPETHRDKFRRYLPRALVSTLKSSPMPILNTPESKTMLVNCRRNQDVDRQWAAFRYMFKGLQPNLSYKDASAPGGLIPIAQVAGLELADQGEVSVKRMGVSRGLDDKAQTIWNGRLELPPMDPSLGNCPGDLYGSRFIDWYLANSAAVEKAGDEIGEEIET